MIERSGPDLTRSQTGRVPVGGGNFAKEPLSFSRNQPAVQRSSKVFANRPFLLRFKP